MSFTKKEIKKWVKERDINQLINAIEKGSFNSDSKKKAKMFNTCAKALIKISGSKAVEPLYHNVNHYIYRELAIKALIKIGQPTIDFLISVLKKNILYNDYNENVITILTEMGWNPSSEKEKMLVYISEERFDKCAEFGQIVVEPLIKALNYKKEKSTRVQIYQTLKNIGTEKAIEAANKNEGIDEYGEPKEYSVSPFSSSLPNNFNHYTEVKRWCSKCKSVKTFFVIRTVNEANFQNYKEKCEHELPFCDHCGRKRYYNVVTDSDFHTVDYYCDVCHKLIKIDK